MTKFFILMISVAMMLFSACNESQSQQQGTAQEKMVEENESGGFGKVISEDGAIPVETLATIMGASNSITSKVKGEVDAVCQKKGCWMNLKAGKDQLIRVTFKDYGFFVPKDLSGKMIVAEGIAYYDTTSVETLQHFAEDAGKSKEEIEAITEPEVELLFEAEGVIVL